MSRGSRLGVLGWPVSHSRSPQMHNAALRAVGLSDWRYQLLPVPPALFEAAVRALPAAGFRGVNVTIPHKETARALADRVDPSTSAIGAANLLLFEDDGSICAENTDALALIELLPSSLDGSTALVLGAGGSARAAAWALRHAGSEVRVCNRTPERAQALAEDLGVTAVTALVPADFLVNCTPVGLLPRDGGLKQAPVQADEIAMFGSVIDLAYSRFAGETALVAAAKRAGKPTVDGLEVLIAQGALSFERFTGRTAPRDRMRAAARDGES